MKKIIAKLIPLFLIMMLGISVFVQAGGVGSDPYYIEGVVYDTDGTTEVSGATIVIERVSTGETNLVNADGTSKTSTSDPPKVTVSTNSNGTYIFELLNMATFADGDSFKITATKGTDSGSVTIVIDIDSPPGYDGADITFGEGVEVAAELIDMTYLCWGGFLVGIIVLFLIIAYTRKNKTG